MIATNKYRVTTEHGVSMIMYASSFSEIRADMSQSMPGVGIKNIEKMK